MNIWPVLLVLQTLHLGGAAERWTSTEKSGQYGGYEFSKCLVRLIVINLILWWGGWFEPLLNR
jgi:hypothetical protein